MKKVNDKYVLDLNELASKMLLSENGKNERDSSCLGKVDHNGDFECGYGVKFSCEDCRFGPLSLIDKRRGYDPRAKKHLKE